MTRTGADAVAWAKRQNSWHPTGMCLVFSRSAFEVSAYYGSAALAWRQAEHKHVVNPGRCPAGVPVFWLGGSHGYGHIAVSIGGGLVRSTDWPRGGQVGTAAISTISRTWGQQFMGWTEDLNRVRIYTPSGRGRGESKPNLDLSNVVRATRNEGAIYHGVKLKKAVAAEVGKGKMNLGSSKLGPEFRAQYRLVQIKFLRLQGAEQGRSSIDGLPGRRSLGWLGDRHGFNVVS